MCGQRNNESVKAGNAPPGLDCESGRTKERDQSTWHPLRGPLRRGFWAVLWWDRSTAACDLRGDTRMGAENSEGHGVG